MADYNRSEAYDLSLFDMPVIKGSAAPQINDTPKKEKTAVTKKMRDSSNFLWYY